jgi:prepilin-type N-terminal cleavage/methylation domain-containing protein
MKNMKRGFTLIEIIASLVIISLLVLVTVPITTNIIQSQKEKAYQEQVKLLLIKSQDWAIANEAKLSYSYNYYLKPSKLLEENFVEQDIIKDPRTSTELSGCVVIGYMDSNKQFGFNYNEESCDSLSDSERPTFTYDNKVITVEVNEPYTYPTVTAVSYSGKNIEVTGPIITRNGQPATSVDSYRVDDEFFLTYRAYDKDLDRSFEDIYKVTVVDTKAPVLRLKPASGINVSSGTPDPEGYYNSNFTIEIPVKSTFTLNDITADIKDNSCMRAGVVNLDYNNCNITTTQYTTSGSFSTNIVGTYQVTFTAKDYKNNMKIITLTIKVMDTEPPVITSIVPSTYDWTTGGIILTVNATDAGVGLSDLAYSINGAAWSASNQSPVPHTQAGTVDIKVRDKVGNTAFQTVSFISQTEYAYQDVSAWSSSYSTTVPADGYYTSRSEYNVRYRTSYWDSCCSQNCYDVTFSNTGHCYENEPYLTCSEWSGGGCTHYVCSSGVRRRQCDCQGCTRYNDNNYTGWKLNTSAPSGTTYLSHTTRTTYAPPSSWGAITGWRLDTPYTQTTSRKPHTRSSVKYNG